LRNLFSFHCFTRLSMSCYPTAPFIQTSIFCTVPERKTTPLTNSPIEFWIILCILELISLEKYHWLWPYYTLIWDLSAEWDAGDKPPGMAQQCCAKPDLTLQWTTHRELFWKGGCKRYSTEYTGGYIIFIWN
jgi:hypothetical protein